MNTEDNRRLLPEYRIYKCTLIPENITYNYALRANCKTQLETHT